MTVTDVPSASSESMSDAEQEGEERDQPPAMLLAAERQPEFAPPPVSDPESRAMPVPGLKDRYNRGTAAAFAIVGSMLVVLSVALVVLGFPQVTPGLRPPANLDDLLARISDFAPIGLAFLSGVVALFAVAAFSSRWIGVALFGGAAFATGLVAGMAVLTQADRLATGPQGQLLPSPVIWLGGSAALIAAALIALVQARRPRHPTSFLAAILGVALVAAALGGSWLWLGGQVPASTIAMGPGGSPSPLPGQISPSQAPTASPVASPTAASAPPSSQPSSQSSGTPGEWAITPPLPGRAIWSEGVANLGSGRVLVVGGADGSSSADAVANAAIFDEATDTWTAVANMHEQRAYPTVLTLHDGTVLVIGGSKGHLALATAERFDPGTGVWTETGPLSAARTNAQAALLPDGRVLVAGGSNGPAYKSTDTAEIYDPTSNTWSRTTSMVEPRADGMAAVLPDGRILVIGGASLTYTTKGAGSVFASTEIYDPVSTSWTSGPSMNHPRWAFDGAVLSDGRILVAGGWSSTATLAPSLSSTEILDPAGGGWSDAGTLSTGRGQLRVVALTGSQAVAIGGISPSYGVLSSVDLFGSLGTWTTTGSLPVGVFWPAAVTLPDNRVLVAGGATNKSASHLTSSAELFQPPAP